jgi:hypothetical protein
MLSKAVTCFSMLLSSFNTCNNKLLLSKHITSQTCITYVLTTSITYFVLALLVLSNMFSISVTKHSSNHITIIVSITMYYITK